MLRRAAASLLLRMRIRHTYNCLVDRNCVYVNKNEQTAANFHRYARPTSI